jgi:hypothetical protein
MEENTQVSEDQFKIQHLRNRIAQITVEYEDRLADAATKFQIVAQEFQKLQEENAQLAAKIVELAPEEFEETADETPDEPSIEVDDPTEDDS